MRVLAFCLCAALVLPTYAGIPNWVVPSPFSILMTIGQWVVIDSEKVYHVQVESTGATEQDARTQGFKLAIDDAIGSLVLSETNLRNKTLQSNDFVNYSSGYIHDFKYVSKYKSPDGITLVMDVWVKHSKVSERIATDSKDKANLQGGKMAVTINSIQEQNKSGDAVVKALLKDFPHKAWDVNITAINYNVARRDVILEVDFQVGWKPKFVDALDETVQILGKRTQPNYHKSGVGINYSACVFCKDKYYLFDEARGALVVRLTDSKKPMVLISLIDVNSKPIWQGCKFYTNLNGHDKRSLYHNTGYNFTVHADRAVHNQFKINVSNIDTKTLDRVDMRIVSESQCSNI